MKNWSVTEPHTENGYQRLKQKIQKEGGHCAKCPSVKDITVDHIIPRQFLTMLGFHEAYKEGDNLQLLCKKCNVEKGNILDYTNPKTLPLLKHYINRWIKKHGALYLEMMTRKITARCLCHPEPDTVTHPAWSKPTYVPAAAPKNKKVDDDDDF